jgi:hypothetical protein
MAVLTLNYRKSLSRKIILPYIVIAGHLAALIIFHYFFSFLEFFNQVPDYITLSKWDALWYKSIADTGYKYVAGMQSNIAFFPLFSLLWKFLQVSAFGISLVNLMLLLISFVLLYNLYHLKPPKLLLLLSTPSLFFCFVPYSEALFFFCTTFLFIGFEKKNIYIIALALFFACMTRAASMLFIPIILFCFFLQLDQNKKNNLNQLWNAILLIFICIASIMLSCFIQYLDTGAFFATFGAQKAWGKELGLPSFYLNTWGEIQIVWLDGLAFLIGGISIITCVALVIRKLKNFNKKVNLSLSFTLGYFSIITLVLLFYGAKNEQGQTILFSFNRFIFATSFFCVFLIYSLRLFKISFKNISIFSILSILVWGSFNLISYRHGKMYAAILFLYSFIYLLITNKTIRLTIFSGLYIFNLIYQLFLFNKFLKGHWVG